MVYLFGIRKIGHSVLGVHNVSKELLVNRLISGTLLALITLGCQANYNCSKQCKNGKQRN